MKEHASQDGSSPQLIFLAHASETRIGGVTIGALIEEIESGKAEFNATFQGIRGGSICQEKALVLVF